MKITRRIFSDLAEIILEGGAKKATKFFSEKLTVKATRKLYGGKRPTRFQQLHGIAEILFTIGRPNYEEREFIKKAKKAGEPFPIKKILIKWPSK
jgi:hypothetical protein